MKRIAFYWFFLRRFLSFYFRARTIYDVHSPMAADFLREVVEDDRRYYAFNVIEALRQRLLRRQNEQVTIQDYGAGSRVDQSQVRRLSSIARYSAISPPTGRLLFRTVRYFHPDTLLELGTSLGISTLYLATPDSKSKVITIEGCPNTASQAAANFKKLGIGNISLLNGPFAEKLPAALASIPRLDLLYLDGDHRRGASLDYFQKALEKAYPESVFIIADIHWSKEMEQAWQEMVRHPAVTLSIDLFQVGLLFFNKNMREKQHLRIVRARWKPWHMGFFWRKANINF